MSGGKEAARDLRYGRRGGGWLPPEKPAEDVKPLVRNPSSSSALLAHMKVGHEDITNAASDASETELRQWHDADHTRCGADKRHRHDL